MRRLTIDELQKQASRLGYDLIKKKRHNNAEHNDCDERWVLTSKLDKVNIEGDSEAYITLVDDALYEFYPSLWMKYNEVTYCKIKEIPREIEFIQARRKNLFSKSDFRREFLMSEKLRENFKDLYDKSREINFFPPPSEGYTKENVSEYLDSINKKNGFDWRIVK